MKKFNQSLKDAITEEIKMLLHASRDCLRNQGKDTLNISFSAHDGYYGEAFGVLRALVILGYGYFGSTNLNAVEERNSDDPDQNLRWFFAKLEREVLEEEGFYDKTYHCEYCLEQYGKDDLTLLARKREIRNSELDKLLNLPN